MNYWNDIVEHFSKVPNTPESAYFLMFAYKKEGGELARQMIYRTGSEEFKKIITKVLKDMKC